MLSLDTEKLTRSRKACVLIGIGLLVLSITLFTSTLLGVFALEVFAVAGHSGLRTLAAIAIAGCLLAAIGYYDE